MHWGGGLAASLILVVHFNLGSSDFTDGGNGPLFLTSLAITFLQDSWMAAEQVLVSGKDIARIVIAVQCNSKLLGKHECHELRVSTVCNALSEKSGNLILAYLIFVTGTISSIYACLY